MTRSVLAAFAAALIAGATVPADGHAAAKAPATWDNLVQVKSKKFDLAYLAPGADFRPYTKVMLDPPEVAFKKNWVRDYNNTTRMKRITEDDTQRVVQEVGTKFREILAKAYADAGFQVVQSPGPDVLRARTGIINLSVSSPDVPTAGRSYSFSQEAGEATFVLEVRDSESGQILGRAVDRRLAGETTALLRNSVTNRSDFERLFRTWAKQSVEGLQALKAMGPVQTAGAATPKN